MNAEENVIQTLTNSKNPLKTSEIAEITGIEQKEVVKAIKSLKEQGTVISPKNCYYSVSR